MKAYVFKVSEGSYDDYMETITHIYIVPNKTPTIDKLMEVWSKMVQAERARVYPNHKYKQLSKKYLLTNNLTFDQWFISKYKPKVMHFDEYVN